MKCRTVRTRLLRGRMNPDVALHLRECRDCREIEEALAALQKDAQSGPAGDVSRAVVEETRRRVATELASNSAPPRWELGWILGRPVSHPVFALAVAVILLGSATYFGAIIPSTQPVPVIRVDRQAEARLLDERIAQVRSSLTHGVKKFRERHVRGEGERSQFERRSSMIRSRTRRHVREIGWELEEITE